MAETKIVFVAFAIDDERQRDFLKGQSLHPRAPYFGNDLTAEGHYGIRNCTCKHSSYV